LEADKTFEDYLRKKNPEAKLLIKIFAIIGFVVMVLLLAGFIFIRINAPQLLEFSKGISESTVKVSLDSLEGAAFISGMKGCENVLPLESSSGVYISCLDGYIHSLGKDQSGKYIILKSFKAGEAVLGMTLAGEKGLFAAVCTGPLESWRSAGGAVYFISGDFNKMEKLTADHPSINGLCSDVEGNLYFTSSNFNYLNPEGSVYMAVRGEDGRFELPMTFIPDAGLANGLYFDPNNERIFFSNTIGGVYSFAPGAHDFKEEYLKTRFMEACDDLCTDSGGNIWMTDPGHSSIKMFNPGTNRLTRFVIEGMGQASSCRSRTENGIEMLFITELKKSNEIRNTEFDGRGALVLPAKSLLSLLEPVLIKNNSGP
jgi:sugar lactone lactonase YvrE